MAAEREERSAELTSTLHLGIRGALDSSHSAVESLLASASSEEKAIYQALLDGSSRGSMVIVNRGPSRGARFLLDEGICTIGRAADSSIFLDDVTVSRHHASIDNSGGVATFSDSGSLNGSYINNSAVTEKVLSLGDEIQIGKFHLLFITSSKNSANTSSK